MSFTCDKPFCTCNYLYSIFTLDDHQATTVLLVTDCIAITWVVLSLIIMFVYYKKHKQNPDIQIPNFKYVSSIIPILSALVNYANAYITEQRTSLVAAGTLVVLSISNLTGWATVEKFTDFTHQISFSVGVVVSAFAVLGVSGKSGHVGKIPVGVYTGIVTGFELLTCIFVAVDMAADIAHRRIYTKPHSIDLYYPHTNSNVDRLLKKLCSKNTNENSNLYWKYQDVLHTIIIRNRKKVGKVKFWSLWWLTIVMVFNTVPFVVSLISTLDLHNDNYYYDMVVMAVNTGTIWIMCMFSFLITRVVTKCSPSCFRSYEYVAKQAVNILKEASENSAIHPDDMAILNNWCVNNKYYFSENNKMLDVVRRIHNISADIIIKNIFSSILVCIDKPYEELYGNIEMENVFLINNIDMDNIHQYVAEKIFAMLAVRHVMLIKNVPTL